MAERVLLTGISGFIGGHIALALLDKGYVVRGSVRSPQKASEVQETLARHGADVTRLELVTLDLLRDDGWTAAMAEVSHLVHSASPFFVEEPKDRMELIRPAVEGTERALRAALAAGVGRIVLTSSVAAISYGHDREMKRPFTEADWTRLGGPGVSAYTESKTRAEQAAWALVDEAGRRNDMAVINPALVLGPLLDKDPGTSAGLVLRLLDGSIPALPDFSFGLVDVRDVAALHVAALISPAAGGRRHIASNGTFGLAEIAQMLREGLEPTATRRLPRLRAPDWAMRLYALIDSELRGTLHELGHRRLFDNTVGEKLLGRPFTPAHDAVLATARSFREQGLLG